MSKKIIFRMCMVIVCVLCLAVVCLTAYMKRKHSTLDEGKSQDKDLQGILEDNIWQLSIESMDEETEERKSIDVYLNERRLVVDEVETNLTEEQCQELRRLILDYSYQVHDQKYDYWPHTEEYPEMLVLFRYRVCYGEKEYSEDGALCYPEGWEMFIKTLENYVQYSGEKTENTTEILLPPNGEIDYTTEELEMMAQALDGDKDAAAKVLKQLNGFGIYGIHEAKMINKEKKIMQIVNTNLQCYILWFRGNVHIEAIQKDNMEGEFIYMETL